MKYRSEYEEMTEGLNDKDWAERALRRKPLDFVRVMAPALVFLAGLILYWVLK